ncbi:hypothetical protein VPHG_00072 [Vibrio phage 11895-B1]|uniref:hypothetical protein n=1 Tax=Vibrio phage 11895-B1 TaxID=754075 RepID=UPI0002C09609|nr:hypothetical protein VPHG_00072 [Vibrio phage 11895-B1]AGH32139.1 hypothetical protein VPHG_00072 [Vibrio phage 11895-B1]
MIKTIYNQCEHLMSYPIGKIFTSDTPTTKEKKSESRCTNIVDKYYKIDSNVHQRIRNLLHDVDSSLLLMCNTVALESCFDSCGRLQAQFEHRRKHIQSLVKPEPQLKQYYETLGKADWFGLLLDGVKIIADEYNFEVDTVLMKGYYFDALKQEQKELKE